MARLLLVSATTGYQTRRFAEVIEQLGHTLVLATDRCHIMDDPWGDQARAVKFAQPEISAVSLDQEIGELDGVLALGDKPALVAAALSERRKSTLRYHPFAAARAASDKNLARQSWLRAGLLVPKFKRLLLTVDVEEAARQTGYPCVLKPLHLSASRGVIRADNEAEFRAAFRRIQAMLPPEEEALQVEEYIPGQEFALEGVVTRGELQTLAIFDKPDPLEGPFFEETIYVTPSRAPDGVQASLIATTAAAIRALGLSDGPVHAEMRWNERGTWMLEVAARPIGGLCAESLRFGSESTMGLEELLVRHALGEDTRAWTREPAASGVMMVPIPRGGTYIGVSGEEQARAVPGVVDVIMTAKPGQLLVPLPEGASYLGFLFARSDTPAAVEAALRQAHGELRFEIQQALPVLQ